jgi:glucose dehydrogenase
MGHSRDLLFSLTVDPVLNQLGGVDAMIQSVRRSALLGGLVATSCAGAALGQGATPQSITSLLQDDKQWPMAAKDYANTRFSKLDQINANNVGKMKLAWTFSVGAPRGQEMAPLAVNGTIYVMAPYAGVRPNQVFALDAASGDVKWSYAPKPNQAAEGVACCDVVTRGNAYDNGKIFLATLDDYGVALDSNTGKELWHTKLNCVPEQQRCAYDRDVHRPISDRAAEGGIIKARQMPQPQDQRENDHRDSLVGYVRSSANIHRAKFPTKDPTSITQGEQRRCNRRQHDMLCDPGREQRHAEIT